MSTCVVADCVKVVRARGLCGAHYERVRTRGTLDLPTRDDRFEAKYAIDATSGCWLWHGALTRSGYGNFWDGARNTPAHAYAYERRHGTVPADRELDHFRCETRRCCNPDHVRPVTTRENVLRTDGPSSLNLAKRDCVRGHPLSGVNLRVDTHGNRHCRACAAMHSRERRERLRSVAA